MKFRLFPCEKKLFRHQIIDTYFTNLLPKKLCPQKQWTPDTETWMNACFLAESSPAKLDCVLFYFDCIQIGILMSISENCNLKCNCVLRSVVSHILLSTKECKA